VETELERLLVRLMGDSSHYQQMLVQAQGATTEAMEHMQQASAGIQALTGSLNEWGQSAMGIISQLGIAIGGLAIGKHAVALANSAENMQIKFGVMVGNEDRAKDLITDLTKLGAETPYQLQDLLQSSQMLLTYGTNVEEILPILKSLGDVTGGDAMKLQRMTYAMSQVQSQGRMTGHVMREMAMAGFNPVQILAEDVAKRTGVSVPRAMAKLTEHMHKGGLSIAEVKKAFTLATGEGGRFHDNMLKNSQSVTGLFSTMVDNIDMILRDFGGTIVEAMHIKEVERAFIDFFANAGQWFASLSPEVTKLGGLVISLTAVVGGLGLAWTILIPVAKAVFGPFASGVMGAIKGIQSLIYFWGIFDAAQTMSTFKTWFTTAAPVLAIAAIGAAIIAIGVAWAASSKGAQDLSEALVNADALNKRIMQSLADETTNFIKKLDEIRDPSQKRSAIEDEMKRLEKEIKGTNQGLEQTNKLIKDQASAVTWFARTTGIGDPLGDLKASAQDSTNRLEEMRRRVKLLTEELKKMTTVSQNEEALAALDKLNEKFETQLKTMFMTKTEAEIYKSTKGVLTGAELEHTRVLAQQVEYWELVKKRQEELKKGTEDLIKSLFEEISTAGMTADQIKLWKLEQLGLTGATEQSLMILMQYAQVANNYKEDLKKGKDLMKEVRTPTEVYNDRLKELQKWLQEGAINQTVYNRAMEDAKKKLHDAAGGATHAREELQKLDAVLAGGGEAYTRMVEYQERVFGVGRTAGGVGGNTGGGTVSAIEPIVQPLGTVPAGPGTNMLNEQQIQLLKSAVDYLATIAQRAPIQLSGANLR
jgi:hypothetical protein